MEIGLYPLLVDDRCHWLAADFDGPAAMLDALAYLKAARAVEVPAALEVSRSGIGRPRVDLLHRAGASGTARTARLRPAAGGDGDARADGSGQLRPAVPLPGRAPDRAASAT